MSVRHPSNDSELKTAVRAETSYEDTPDELPSDTFDDLVERAKARLEVQTGTDQWYSDNGLGLALVAYTCMRAKASLENISMAGYSIGAEDVDFHHADPDDNLQMQQWAEDVRVGLDASSLDSSTNLQMADGANYVGENYYFE
jgi:hypothetical protein